MRAAPAFQASLQRFGVWQGAMLGLSALGLIVVGAWLTTRAAPLLAPSSLLAAGVAALTAASGLSLAKMPAVRLRWDGRAWHLGPVAGEPVSRDLSVAIDLGPWMLLRFKPDLAARAVWLPTQRRGLESAWHALRCSVYSPRPAPAEDSSAGV